MEVLQGTGGGYFYSACVGLTEGAFDHEGVSNYIGNWWYMTV